jgi:hypothetical protein
MQQEFVKKQKEKEKQYRENLLSKPTNQKN